MMVVLPASLVTDPDAASAGPAGAAVAESRSLCRPRVGLCIAGVVDVVEGAVVASEQLLVVAAGVYVEANAVPVSDDDC